MTTPTTSPLPKAGLIANGNRDPRKGRPIKPDDFNPYMTKAERPDVVVVDQNNIGLLRKAFTGR